MENKILDAVFIFKSTEDIAELRVQADDITQRSGWTLALSNDKVVGGAKEECIKAFCLSPHISNQLYEMDDSSETIAYESGKNEGYSDGFQAGVMAFAKYLKEHKCSYNLDNYHSFDVIDIDYLDDLVEEFLGE